MAALRVRQSQTPSGRTRKPQGSLRLSIAVVRVVVIVRAAETQGVHGRLVDVRVADVRVVLVQAVVVQGGARGLRAQAGKMFVYKKILLVKILLVKVLLVKVLLVKVFKGCRFLRAVVGSGITEL